MALAANCALGVWLTLSNGMQVVVIPDHRAPVVTHMVWYRVGAADETSGQSGIAHFLEHLMFKGTQKHPGEEFRERVAAIGGDENAFTSSDYTAYFQRVAADRLELMMRMESDRMVNLQLDAQTVATERDVIAQVRSAFSSWRASNAIIVSRSKWDFPAT